MRVHSQALMLTAVLFGIVPTNAGGQDQPTDCQQVAQNVNARVSPQHYVDALRDLRDGCRGTAAGVLAQQWRNPPAESLSLARLVETSAGVRAPEVSQALLEVVASETSPRGSRFGAIQALATHFRPCLTLTFMPVTTRLGKPYVPVGVGRLPGVDVTERAQAGVPESILQRLDAVSRSSPDSVVREAARKSAILLREIAANKSGAWC